MTETNLQNMWIVDSYRTPAQLLGSESVNRNPLLDSCQLSSNPSCNQVGTHAIAQGAGIKTPCVA
jgi:hypothetical protein